MSTSVMEQSAPSGAPTGAMEPTASGGRMETSRGVTVITPSVVERIAQREAAQVEGVAEVVPGGGGLRRFLALASDPATTSADAHFDPGQAALDLTVHVRWPEPAMTVAERVRDRVIERVQALTGVVLTEVHVTVPKLVVGGRRPRPRVQ